MAMLKNILLFSIILGSVLVFSPSAFAFEPIIITISDGMSSLDLDGKWTHPREWKKSSLNEFNYEDQGRIILRTAHQGDFVYVFIDNLSDRTLDRHADRAIVCFDSLNNKSIIPDENDFCFMAVLENEPGYTLQGGSLIATNGYFEKIPNHEDTFALSAISDNNDRYVKIPHTSYEFKIPLEILQRNNIYGFYFQVFDASSNTLYEYPKNLSDLSLVKIPSPSQWGEIISPDNSLPEFHLPFLIMIVLVSTIIIFSKTKNNLKLHL